MDTSVNYRDLALFLTFPVACCLLAFSSFSLCSLARFSASAASLSALFFSIAAFLLASVARSSVPRSGVVAGRALVAGGGVRVNNISSSRGAVSTGEAAGSIPSSSSEKEGIADLGVDVPWMPLSEGVPGGRVANVGLPAPIHPGWAFAPNRLLKGLAIPCLNRPSRERTGEGVESVLDSGELVSALVDSSIRAGVRGVAVSVTLVLLDPGERNTALF